jgi:hypothetical protein
VYERGVVEATDPLLRSLHLTILEKYNGPDCYWQPPAHSPTPKGVTTFFGRSHVVPFPFVLVFYYDQGGECVSLEDPEDLDAYVRQNESSAVRGARHIRRVLRALEGQTVFAPLIESRQLGRDTRWPWRKSSRTLEMVIQYRRGRLRIGRNCELTWRGYNFNSGFDVTLVYEDGRGRRADGTVEQGLGLIRQGASFGIADDFHLTPPLAHLFRDNRDLIEQRLAGVENLLAGHRAYFCDEAQRKYRTLSHAFLFNVQADGSLSSKGLAAMLDATELDPRVRSLPYSYAGSITLLEERMKAINRSRVTQWWFVAWDDIWRRNHTTVMGLQDNPASFSPHYRISICYRPLPRAELESFLEAHGLWSASKKRRRFFSTGFLNRMYFHVSMLVFDHTPYAIPLRVGAHHHEVSINELATIRSHVDRDDSFGSGDRVVNVSESTWFTGDGTNQDDDAVRPRRAFLFEEMYDRPRVRFVRGQRLAWVGEHMADVLEAFEAWLGLRPYLHRRRPPGVYLALKERDDGGYGLPTHTRVSQKASRLYDTI